MTQTILVIILVILFITLYADDKTESFEVTDREF